eukprot:SM000073S21401  [mRNA]  locus=s73:54452:55874:- [translate_table: standard]
MAGGGGVAAAAAEWERERRRRKVTEYERFLEERLKADLQLLTDESVCYQEQADARTRARQQAHRVTNVACTAYMFGPMPRRSLTGSSNDLAKSIGLMQQQKLTRMRSMVSLGSEVYMQADVPDTSRIFVNVGLGFHVEFTLPEAISFAATKEQHLKRRADAQTVRIVDLKAQIKLVTEGIRELMNIPWEA